MGRPAGLAALERTIETDLAGVEGALLVACLRAQELGAEGAPDVLVAAAPSLAPPFDELALGLVSADGLSALPDDFGPLARYYELRWGAAKAFGRIDGKRYAVLVLDELHRDEDFLDGLLLRAAAVVFGEAVDDYVEELLFADPTPARLRAAMFGHRRVLVRLVERGWIPSEQEWSALLSVAGPLPERDAEELWKLGLDTPPETRERVSLRLLRNGSPPPPLWFERLKQRFQPEGWLAFFLSAGDRADTDLIPDLTTLLARVEDPSFVPHGWVALARLGHVPSISKLEGALAAEPGPLRERCLAALARVAYDPAIGPWLKKAAEIETLTPTEQSHLAAGAVLAGRAPDRPLLRTALRRGRLASPFVSATVLALAKKPQPEDLVVLGELFPRVEDPELNLSLAVGLLLNLEPRVRRILRAALWGDDWARSMLAAGLFYRVGGYHVLADEIASAPGGLSDERRRSVGFALGEFGGLPALERYRRENPRASERDPLLQGALLGALAAERADD